MSDFEITNHDTIFVVKALTQKAKDWILQFNHHGHHSWIMDHTLAIKPVVLRKFIAKVQMNEFTIHSMKTA